MNYHTLTEQHKEKPPAHQKGVGAREEVRLD